MPVTPDASQDEFSSPFFLKNKEICEEFDAIMIQLGGNTKGSYNAWSYNASGKVPHPYKWEFRIKKATFSSGSLMFSPKKQNQLLKTKWIARSFYSDCHPFLIRRKRNFDFLRIQLSDLWSRHQKFPSYFIRSSSPSHTLIYQLSEILDKLYDSKELQLVSYQNNTLKIELQTEKIYPELISQLMNIKP